MLVSRKQMPGTLYGESKSRHIALAVFNASRNARSRCFLAGSLNVRARRRLTRKEEDALLGFGPEGV